MFNTQRKQRENYQLVQYFYHLLKSKLKNQPILEDIMSELKYGADKNQIVSHTDSSILIKNKKGNEQFYLVVGDYTIEYELIKWEGRCTETKTIEFDGDIITVTSTEHNRVTTDGQYSTFEKIKKIETYDNDELSYKREIHSSTSAQGISNYATDSETFINKDKVAVERRITISEDDESEYSTSINYLKSSYYDVAPFDTSKQTKSVYMYGMGYCTQEEYEEFIKNFNESHTLKKLG